VALAGNEHQHPCGKKAFEYKFHGNKKNAAAARSRLKVLSRLRHFKLTDFRHGLATKNRTLNLCGSSLVFFAFEVKERTKIAGPKGRPAANSALAVVNDSLIRWKGRDSVAEI
jgi:hypothetical protein